MRLRRFPLRPLLLGGFALGALAGCTSLDTYQVQAPETLGSQVAVLAIEVPASALTEGETATFDIAFEIGWRGNVERSSMRATSRADLQDTILAQHRQWIYAVATRREPCAATTYAGVQHIALTRTGGRLSMALEPARVERQIEYSKAEWIAAMGRLRPESIRPPVYPDAALREGGQATVGVMFEFGPDGKARDAFAVNVANDRWGMTKAALAAVQRYELKEPPGRAIRGCQTFEFKLR